MTKLAAITAAITLAVVFLTGAAAQVFVNAVLNRDARTRAFGDRSRACPAEIRKLRTERHQHQQQQPQRAFGARLDDLAKADLLARVDELTYAYTELVGTIQSYKHDNDIRRTRGTDPR